MILMASGSEVGVVFGVEGRTTHVLNSHGFSIGDGDSSNPVVLLRFRIVSGYVDSNQGFFHLYFRG